MAVGASAGQHAGMGETDRGPRSGGMTYVARLRGGNVRDAFRLRIDRDIGAAMAGDAIARCDWAGCSRVAHHSGIERSEI